MFGKPIVSKGDGAAAVRPCGCLMQQCMTAKEAAVLLRLLRCCRAAGAVGALVGAATLWLSAAAIAMHKGWLVG